MFSPLSKFQGQAIDRKEKRRKWWLFHATDFQSLMYPCFIICRILGTLPYRINGSSFETSKPCYILSNIIMFIFCSSALILICFINISKRFDDVRETIAYNFCHITSSFIMIVTFVSIGQRMRLLQTIMKISSRLPSDLYQKQSILIHTKDIFGFVYLFLQTLHCHYKMQLPILINVFVLHNTLLVFHMDMLYINCVCVLKACFEKINNDLANLHINDESHLVKWIQRNPFLLMELNALKKQHLMISDTVQKFNILFSPQLLATIVLSFTEITFELYFNMVQWENGLSINWTKQVNYSYVIVYIMRHLIKMALMAWACETGKNQALKINTTIHDVLNKTNDEEITFELQLFSLQTMHCDNTFGTKGLNLDATLLTAMMSTVTTYLLILIQFLIISHSCDGKTASNITQEI